MASVVMLNDEYNKLFQELYKNLELEDILVKIPFRKLVELKWFCVKTKDVGMWWIFWDVRGQQWSGCSGILDFDWSAVAFSGLKFSIKVKQSVWKSKNPINFQYRRIDF